MERSSIALPDRDHLARIGELAHTVSSVEWTIPGDLHRLADKLPPDLVLGSLVPMTTAQIASAVEAAVKAIHGGPIKQCPPAGYKAPYAAVKLRDDMLRARPATRPGPGQRRSRVEVANRKTTGERFCSAISTLNERLVTVNAVPPPLVPVVEEE